MWIKVGSESIALTSNHSKARQPSAVPCTPVPKSKRKWRVLNLAASFGNFRTRYVNASSLLCPKPSLTICTYGNDPWLSRMPPRFQYSQASRNLVSFEDFERHDERVGQQVRVNGRVKDVNASVVRSRKEERVRLRERDGPERSRMVPKRLVRRRRKVHVVPDEPLVVRTDNDVVSERMNVEARDPFQAWVERLDERLSHQVVDANVSLSRDEEMRFCRMERDALDFALLSLEGRLRLVL